MTYQLNRRILIIDDQKSIHEDYRKVIGSRQRDPSVINEAAMNLFGEEEESGRSAWQESFEIDSAYQGEEGLQMVQKALEEGRPYALAFVDIRMPPGWDGVDTVRRIWEVDPEILIVICSAYSDYSWEQMVEHLGRTDRFLILKKPFEQIEVRQFAMALTERWNLARTDVLTGLLNRRAFVEHLRLEQARALRLELPLSCAMVDLDFFKRINDEYGHLAGDLMLKATADALRDHSRLTDHICRFGGEEFCVLLPNADEAGALAWGETIRSAIGNLTIVDTLGPIRVTASVGIATLRQDQKAADALVTHADLALQMAKRQGRNRVALHSSMSRSGDSLEQMLDLDGPLKGICAAQVMTAPIPSLQRHAHVEEVVDLLLQYQVTALPVVDEHGLLAGMISEKELMPQMLLPGGPAVEVGKLMRTQVVAYAKDTPVIQVFDFLSRVTVGQVFVVCEGRPLGAISRGSLLRWLSDWLHANISEGGKPGRAEFLEHPRARLLEATSELAVQAGALADDSGGSAVHGVPPLIEVMFKMQELMNELLGCSCQAKVAAGSE
jgi:diguanylate cyclase (GGDEF)-like protein